MPSRLVLHKSGPLDVQREAQREAERRALRRPEAEIELLRVQRERDAVRWLRYRPLACESVRGIQCIGLLKSASTRLSSAVHTGRNRPAATNPSPSGSLMSRSVACANQTALTAAAVWARAWRVVARPRARRRSAREQRRTDGLECMR
jgi:hypothetical protein